MDNNYKQLMAAIVVRAVKDYSKILRKSRLSDLDKRKKFELEQFFRSEWGELLSELSGEFCIEKIKENVAKEWLNRGRKLNSEINSLIKKQQRALEQACNTTSPLQQDKVQSSKGNTAESNMIRYADYNDKINKKVDELREVKKEILSAISKLDNKVYKTLLTERYIKFSRWEQVAKSINKTCTNTKARLHRSALKAVSKLYNN
jgi:hypothetical protein